MAKTCPPRNSRSVALDHAQVGSDPTFLDINQAKLRRTKLALLKRFPLIKSSHLTEAMARGYGFASNAALMAAVHEDTITVAPSSFDAQGLRERLLELGYPLREDFSTSTQPDLKPSAEYLARLDRLRWLAKAPGSSPAVISKLRKECATEFALAFGLGYPKDVNDKKVIQRWGLGVDHGNALPGWGERARRSDLYGDRVFPGTDHVMQFYQRLPVGAQGKRVDYQSAFVSMPYSDKSRLAESTVEASALAGNLGWTVSIHNDWAWYQPGSTALILYRRSTPYEKVLVDWETSFTRWLLTNRSKLVKSGGLARQYLLEDLVACPHLPLDLIDYDDCIERYIEEFAPKLDQHSSTGMGQQLKLLVEKWQQQRPLATMHIAR